MIRPIIFTAAFAALSACSGGNPFTGDDAADVPSDDPNETYIGEVTNFVYDADTDELIVSNLPFDGPDGRYPNNAVLSGVVTGFEVYESQQTAQTGQRKYFAVYRATANGRAAAVGTGDYGDFGFGGAMYGRSDANVVLPIGSGELVYNGDYAGVRVVSPGTIQMVSGDARIDVDLLDFDLTGAVEGWVSNRTYFATDGTPLGNLPTIILNTASISDTGTILASSAQTLDSNFDPLQTGQWEGTFAGPNGEEIFGVIVIQGLESEGATADVKETGVFSVAN